MDKSQSSYNGLKGPTNTHTHTNTQTRTHPHLASFLVFSPVLFTISILSSYQACLHQGLCNYCSFSWISLLPENHETGSLISKPLYKCHLFIEIFQTILFTSQHSISPHHSALFYFSPQHFSPIWHSIYSFIFFIVNSFTGKQVLWGQGFYLICLPYCLPAAITVPLLDTQEILVWSVNKLIMYKIL